MSTRLLRCAPLSENEKEYFIEMEDIVVVTQDDNGKVTLHQATNLPAAGAVVAVSGEC